MRDAKYRPWSAPAISRVTQHEIQVDGTRIAHSTYSYTSTGQLTALYNYHRINGVDVQLSAFTDLGYDDHFRLQGFTRTATGLPAYDGSYTFAYNDKDGLTGDSLHGADHARDRIGTRGSPQVRPPVSPRKAPVSGTAVESAGITSRTPHPAVWPYRHRRSDARDRTGLP